MGMIFMGLEPLDAFPDAGKGIRFGGGAVRELTNGPGFAIPILPEWGSSPPWSLSQPAS